jgi:hypothetical protein
LQTFSQDLSSSFDQNKQMPGTGDGVGGGSDKKSYDPPIIGAKERLARMAGDGVEVLLEPSKSAATGSLVPGKLSSSSKKSENNVDGAYDVFITPEQEIVTTPLLPYYYSWKWRDLIMKYYQQK